MRWHAGRVATTEDRDAGEDPSGPPTPMRLVLRQQGSRVFAFLYAADGSPYATAQVVFPVAATQELPRLEPGGRVDVTGLPDAPVVDAGGVLIRPAGRLGPDERMGALQILAERGDVIAHPDVVGWSESWRTIHQSSSMDPDVWRQRLRRRNRAGIAAIVLLVVSVALAVGGGGTFTLAYLALSGGSFLAELAAWRAARRARRAVDLAERSLAAAPVPMRMRAHWTAGDGLGPLLVATLRPIEDATDPRDPHPAAAAASQVALVGVPEGSTPEGEVEVTVHQVAGAPPVIRWKGQILWPAGPAT